MPVPANTPATVALGPHGYGYIYHGKGRPDRIDLRTGDIEPAGLDAPTAAPTVAAQGATKYYIPRIDVVEFGYLYHTPPVVSIVGACERPAKARAFLRDGQLDEIRISDYGKGYAETPSVQLSESHASGLVLEVEMEDQPTPPASGGSTTPVPVPVKGIKVVDAGVQYLTPPRLSVTSDSGAGMTATATVAGGKVTSVSVVEPGSGYNKPPKVTPIQGGATAVAIARAHVRGQYECYYRYVDDTPESRGGPRVSNLSPVRVVDAGDGAEKLLWSGFAVAAAAAKAKGLTLERWRTTSNQSFTLYRVSGETDDDTLTDEELRDYNRPGYLGLPVVLPNGELNANRFGIPPSDFAVAVTFQDRLWCAVDPSGLRPNALQYSEVDEPESMPDINELLIQTNVKGADSITALVPYGGTLGVFQARHFYRITYVAQPLIDVNVSVGGYRGCLNQRCWDEFDGLLYSMDTQGVYTMDYGGQIKSITDGVADLFTNRIDFTKSKWFSVVADPAEYLLRCSVRFIGDGPGDYPTRMLVYSLQTSAWWEERYPSPLVGAAAVVLPNGQRRVVYGSSSGRAYQLNTGNVDESDGGISSATITAAGSGYTKPPKVTAPGGCGAVLESAITAEGQLLGVYVRTPGYGYSSGQLVIEAPENGTPAAGQYTVSEDTLPISYLFKTGNLEYPSDSMSPDGLPDGGARNISVLFTPTQGESMLKLRMYYNNSPYPRLNIIERDRGTGVVHDASEPVTRVDMDAGTLPDNISSGVCRALFAGKTIDDVRGNDRHVSLELSGAANDSGTVAIHQLDIYGVPSPKG
jgi:hypothetical protein